MFRKGLHWFCHRRSAFLFHGSTAFSKMFGHGHYMDAMWSLFLIASNMRGNVCNQAAKVAFDNIWPSEGHWILLVEYCRFLMGNWIYKCVALISMLCEFPKFVDPWSHVTLLVVKLVALMSQWEFSAFIWSPSRVSPTLIVVFFVFIGLPQHMIIFYSQYPLAN